VQIVNNFLIHMTAKSLQVSGWSVFAVSPAACHYYKYVICPRAATRRQTFRRGRRLGLR